MTEIKILQQKKDKVGRKTLFQNRAFYNLIISRLHNLFKWNLETDVRKVPRFKRSSH